VAIGILAGTVPRQDLIDKRSMRAGDKILLTKAVAVEATAIISREFGDKLGALGMSDAEIEECKQFIALISILEEAQIARQVGGVSAMHDVTEGGLATAIKELSIAGRHQLRIHMDRIPVYPQTEKISRLLGLNPLGLIGSGSLLICCRKDAANELTSRLQRSGIEVTCIGEVLGEGEGVHAVMEGVQKQWPCFEVDEITKLYG
jgi:hydrogenase maturation factor